VKFKDLKLPDLDVGDIFQVIPPGIDRIEADLSKWAFTPHTPYLHHFIGGPPLPEYNNRAIGQSTPGHGVGLQLLTAYNNCQVRVLRLNRSDSADIGQMAWDALAIDGLRPYGYMSMLEIVGELIGIEYAFWKVQHKLKAATAYDVKLGDKGLLCTQLVVDLYRRAGVEILLPGQAAIPAAFQNSIDAGIFVVVAA
jgi:hypothetical protein